LQSEVVALVPQFLVLVVSEELMVAPHQFKHRPIQYLLQREGAVAVHILSLLVPPTKAEQAEDLVVAVQVFIQTQVVVGI